MHFEGLEMRVVIMANPRWYNSVTSLAMTTLEQTHIGTHYIISNRVVASQSVVGTIQ